jgi:hypothetical protein
MSFLVNPDTAFPFGTAAISRSHSLRKRGYITTLCLDCSLVERGKLTGKRSFVNLHLTEYQFKLLIEISQAVLEEFGNEDDSEMIPGKPGFIVTCKSQPVPCDEPSLEDKILWMRWHMATTGSGLKNAWQEHKIRMGWKI